MMSEQEVKVNKHDFVQLIETVSSYHDGALVAIQTESGVIYEIDDVVLEPQSTDGEGNVTSVGSTLWIKVKEY